MTRQLKEKRVKCILGHSLCCQCVKKYNTILASKTESESNAENTNEMNDGDIDEQDEPDDFSSVTPRKKLNTSLETMGISPVNLHRMAQQNRAPNPRVKLDKLVGTLTYHMHTM